VIAVTTCCQTAAGGRHCSQSVW